MKDMLFQILKKDMMKRKGINIILFLFISIATVFLSSSVSNIMVVNSAVDYYLEYAQVPDVNVILNSDKEKTEIGNWLEKEKAKDTLDTYVFDELQVVSEKSLRMHNKTMESDGASLYFGVASSEYNKVYDEHGDAFTLKKGEIALSPSIMKKNRLDIGDCMYYKDHGIEKTFIVKYVMKDAAYGNDMVGMRRFIIQEDDFHDIRQENGRIYLLNIDTKDANAFQKALDKKEFSSIINVFAKDIYTMVYSFDMIMAALLILIGICLILIALLVLRFTLTFTMEEQYQEIGILKAIGLRNGAIKKLFLIKYFVIVCCGAFLGLCCSIPVSQIMIQSVSENMIMASDEINIGINLICMLFVVITVVGFCYLCTTKLNKVSAIQAIHGGNSGARYQKHKSIRLHQRLRMRVPLLLGCNDIVSHRKRYLVLIITFCISFILITIPLNTLNTMTSKEMITKFQLNPNSAVYVRQIELASQGTYTNITQLKEGMNRVKQELQEEGYQANLSAQAIFFVKVKREDHSYRKLMSMQFVGDGKSTSTYSEGSAPQFENEIAISSSIMKAEGWDIGDYVHVSLAGTLTPMIITGTYSDYMQIGQSARLNPMVDMRNDLMFDYWTIMVDMKTDKTQKEMAKECARLFPDYDWSDAQSLVDQNVGGIQDGLKQMLMPMTFLLCGAIMLITLLMEHLFITREKSEIAMMKSVGFRYHSICQWQIARMTLVVMSAMVISIPLSLLSNQFILKPIFAIMGAEVQIQVNVLQVYIIYPGILFIGILIATMCAVRGVKKIDIREMNNLE